MCVFLQQCVDKHRDLAGPHAAKLSKVTTPFCTEAQVEALREVPGEGVLAPIAARVLMKVLYVARLCRPDLLYVVTMLARCVHRWDAVCDARLRRLMCYINCTAHLVQRGFVGDKLAECVLTLCTDSDFAADAQDPKSTSGIYMCIRGPHTFVPLTHISKKQGAVSHSTTEAEIIALELALRQELLPFLDLWEAVLHMFALCPTHTAGGNPLPMCEQEHIETSHSLPSEV